MSRSKTITKFGIPQVNAKERVLIPFHTDRSLRDRIRQAALESGLTQREIIETGCKKQLQELEEQIKSGKQPDYI
ncbi:MAG: hypothetical protein WC647_03990 [Desulfomonilaceae bacterium]|jgi:hypothetical protein